MISELGKLSSPKAISANKDRVVIKTLFSKMTKQSPSEKLGARLERKGKKRTRPTADVTLRPLKFNELFVSYLNDIEKYTNRQIDKIQRDLVKIAIDTRVFFRLSPEKSKAHRRSFSADKKQMIKEWEEHYSTKWPVYTEPVYTKNGKISRMTGGRYDAHEIIENSWNSPHKWWNIHPAKFPTEHQQGIHRKGGYCDMIYNS